MTHNVVFREKQRADLQSATDWERDVFDATRHPSILVTLNCSTARQLKSLGKHPGHLPPPNDEEQAFVCVTHVTTM